MAEGEIFFFNDTATTEIYTLSLHDALPISGFRWRKRIDASLVLCPYGVRSEEHTSELQSPDHLVCRLLLENKTPAFPPRRPPSRPGRRGGNSVRRWTL